MRKLLAALLCAAAGCIDPTLVVCANGVACPLGTHCDEVHATCVSAAQLSVCGDLGDGADCAAGPISGGCFDDVCLPRGCGNRVVELGEVCDDGNQISGDGCNGSCGSDERCGNGVRDPDEACDDGNAISRDGCDSRCVIEQASWTEVVIAPTAITGRMAAYDAGRGMLSYLDGHGGRWDWDGLRWRLTRPARRLNPRGVTYDPDRAELVLISRDDEGVQAYAWRGGEWLAISSGPGPGGSEIHATYDTARRQIVVVERFPIAAWALDGDGAWYALPGATTGDGGAIAVGYDAASDHLVVATDDGVEWSHDGTGWTSSVTGFSIDLSIAFEPARGRLILVDNARQLSYQRVGTAWQELADPGVPCRATPDIQGRPLYHDPVTASLVLVDPSFAQLCQLAETWTASVPALPFGVIGAAYDAAAGGFVFLHTADVGETEAVEAWRFDGDRWLRTGTFTAVGRGAATAVQSPGRATAVVFRGQVACDEWLCGTGDTWGFDGRSWSAIAPPPAGFAPFSFAAAYDPDHRRVLRSAGPGGFWALADDGTTWIQTEIAAIGDGFETVQQLAWDARNRKLVAIVVGAPGGVVFESHDTGWATLPIGPAVLGDYDVFGTVVVADQRSGGIIVLEPTQGEAWTRIGANWIRLPAAPPSLGLLWSAYNPIDGAVLFAGNTYVGSTALILTRSSATPLESCRAGDDLDGDGLAGCDDPECYWACSSCLPYTTCGAP